MAAPVKFSDEAGSGLTQSYTHKAIANLSDGTQLIAVFTNAGTIAIYHTSDRVAFTLKHTIANGSSTFSIDVESGDHFQLAYRNSSDNQMKWIRGAKGAGYSWTLSGVEVITTTFFLSVDITCLDAAGACAVIYGDNVASSPSGQATFAIKVRSSGGAWGAGANIITIFNNFTNTYQADHSFPSMTICRDSAGVAANQQRIFYAVYNPGGQITGGASPRTYMGTAVFNVTTAALVSHVISNDLLPEVTGIPRYAVTLRAFPVSAGVWIMGYTYVISGSNVTAQAVLITWTGAALALSKSVTKALPHVSGYGKPAICWLSSGRLAFFTRRTSGGANVAVFDNATFAWITSSFPFSNTSVTMEYLNSGAGARNANAKADVVMLDNGANDYYYDYSQTPTTPSSVRPLAGSTEVTDLPNLQATLPALQISGYFRRGRWQVANDIGFTTNVKTINEPDSDFDAVSVHIQAVDASNELSQGVRYVRAATVDPFGQVSSYSAGQQFTVSHPPSSTNHAPTGGASRTTGDVVFTWDFSDTSPTDVQTAYQIIIEVNATGVVVLDTGKVLSGVDSATIAIPGAQNDVLLRWKVRLWDSDDVVGGYSAYNTFYPATSPTISVTAPAEAAVITTPNPTYTWTFAATGGRTQVQYRVTVRENIAGTPIRYQSAWIVGAALSHTPPAGHLTTGKNYIVTVEAIDSWGVTGSDSNNFSTAWVMPAAPIFVANDSLYATSGFMRITWTNSQKDANFVRYRIYRRESAGNGAWMKIFEITQDKANYSVDDWTVKSNTSYDYIVVQVASRFGEEVESSYAAFQTVSQVNTDYWLLHPTDPTLNILLSQVSAESLDDQYEQATMELIGRGRKEEYGTHYGWSGSITAEVWDRTDKTARQQRLDLERLRAERQAVFLRNPFGDLWLVSMKDAQIGRIAGVGTREFHDLTLSYQELLREVPVTYLAFET